VVPQDQYDPIPIELVVGEHRNTWRRRQQGTPRWCFGATLSHQLHDPGKGNVRTSSERSKDGLAAQLFAQFLRPDGGARDGIGRAARKICATSRDTRNPGAISTPQKRARVRSRLWHATCFAL
jgi:hypothetical protein